MDGLAQTRHEAARRHLRHSVGPALDAVSAPRCRCSVAGHAHEGPAADTRHEGRIRLRYGGVARRGPGGGQEEAARRYKLLAQAGSLSQAGRLACLACISIDYLAAYHRPVAWPPIAGLGFLRQMHEGSRMWREGSLG